MEFVSERFGANEEISCPCHKCLNRSHGHMGLLEDHLYIHGMASTYDRWIYHGEPSEVEIARSGSHMDDQTSFSGDVGTDEGEEDPDDRLPDMFSDLYTVEAQGPEQSQAQGPEEGTSMFAAVLEEMKKELYPGCASISKFSFVVKLLHLKSFYRISNVAFTAILKLLSSAFPHCSLPTSYQEAKKFICSLGLGYDSIHMCPNNCVLFRKEYGKHNECPVVVHQGGRIQLEKSSLRRYYAFSH
ncbi:hypothetical protein PR202_ga31585 [Eleusine coracana subsp. coracana]|uniref:Transposase-associated domain-containing protein n=1 Tax=Eleusine coracana subsp. coracana TaxID=191504 RepID=A0AAV5DSA3_ELECO|nr:hypothetical protein PR202_ga31585 [Eleusine coracana subsp. coracana]